MSEKKKSTQNSFQRALIYLAVGTELAAAVIAGAFIGMYLDRKFNSGGIFIGIFILLGFVAGVYNMIRILQKGEK